MFKTIFYRTAVQYSIVKSFRLGKKRGVTNLPPKHPDPATSHFSNQPRSIAKLQVESTKEKLVQRETQNMQERILII